MARTLTLARTVLRPFAGLVLAPCCLCISGCEATPPSRPPAPVSASDRTCFILRALDGSAAVREGQECGVRHPPASTFKVPHALIALETGARTGANDLEKWDGTDYGGEDWNRDQTLASALQHSTYWYFKRTAQLIGTERMKDALVRLQYGNATTGDDVTTFWLKGPLKISPDEQADFMERLVRRSLPLEREVMDEVDEMLLEPVGKVWRGAARDVEVTWDPAHTRVYGKTGSMDSLPEGNVRWFVGHVSADGRRYVFASLVVGRAELDFEAVTLAMRGLRAARLVVD